MIYLIVVSFLWGLSFPIIKGYLIDINPIALSFIRFFIAILFFIPFYKRKISSKSKYILIGIVQYGLMYILYLFSFKYLKAYEIAILTTTTPIYILIINQILNKEKKYYLNASLVILACAIITYNSLPSSVIGVLLVQLSNICFAVGQVFYKKININDDNKASTFYMYLGALIIITPLLLFTKSYLNVNIKDNFFPILYLSLIASGLGFYLWNKGLKTTKIKYISIMNNLKIPLAVIFSILLLNEKIDIINLITGSILFLVALY